MFSKYDIKEMAKQLKFCKIEIEKMNFHSSKKTINIAEADINFFYLVSLPMVKRIDAKYFTGYKRDKKLDRYSSRSHK